MVFIALLVAWLLLIVVLTLNDYFLDFEATPPRLMPFIAFTILVTILIFFFKSGREFIDRMPITTLTYIHIVRVPVEIVLWWLFSYGLISETMTFEGLNYDILSGISAPFAGLFLVGLESKSRIAAIIWNVLAVGLLINIVSRAILATPYFFDPMIFDQPNIAVFYFPFILLPTVIVPIVFFCHIASLYQLFNMKTEED